MLAVAASLVLGAGSVTSAQEPSASPESNDAAMASVASPSPTDPLRGTWDYQLTDAEVEVLAALWGPEEAAAVGIPGRTTSIRMAFDYDTWWQSVVFDGELYLLDGVPEGDGGTLTLNGDQLTLTNGRDGWATYRWSVDGNQLTLDLLECVEQSRVGECGDTDTVAFVTEHTYTYSSSDPGY